MARGKKQEEDILADVTTKTTKAELIDKLRSAVKRLNVMEDEVTKKDRIATDERLQKMQEIEENIRQHFTGATPDLRSITLMSTEDEFTEMIDFLDNFEDIMPVAMHRLLAGARAVTGQSPEATEDVAY